jgi:aspartyl-tRNA(Asn)/glutamyl-tRNA(Gln) amidotransferase subunit C
MRLILGEVEHIALLARLDLTLDEKARFCEQLSAILDYAARLQQVDTSHFPPSDSGIFTSGGLRPDIIEQSLAVQDILRNAPQKEQNQFRVPPVLE